MTPTIYVTRNGLLEPLAQSQVLAYLRGIAQDYAITLITYEKYEDRTDGARMAQAMDECERLGIRWLPQRFHSRPKYIAPAVSMLGMAWLVAREVRSQGVQIIHARSYIPAVVALLVGRLMGIPLIFDMRALWPEELITAGRLRRGSILHRAIAAAERSCIRNAAGVVSLTHAAVDYLKRVYPSEMAGQRVVIIPTCADLERFIPAKAQRRNAVGCLGTVLSGWFRLDWLSAFFAVSARRSPGIKFELTTRDNPDLVREAFGGSVLDRLQIAPIASGKVQEVLQGQLASVMFYAGGEASELGRSPTRLGEVLGCGVPVVANGGVGDVASIISQYRVGVLVSGPSEREMDTAFDELQDLLRDPELPIRCRQAAEEVFSLKSGTAAYMRLYRDILEQGALVDHRELTRAST